MNALFFGRSTRQLFGYYDAPAGAGARPRGVVLCNAWGGEYIRAHKAMRRLALLLSRAGLHVLRFDYSGTGDSAGASPEGRLADWVDDTVTAIEELEDTAGITRVSLVGLRLGAMVAALAATKRREVDRLVLWEPVLDGESWARELVGAAVGADEDTFAAGFPFPAELRRELAAIDVEQLAATRAVVSIVATEESAMATALRESRERRGLATVVEPIVAPPVWREEHDFGTGAVPVPVLQRIVTLLS